MHSMPPIAAPGHHILVELTAQKVAAEYLIRGYWKMGTRTGRPPGRPKGAKNKRTAEREAAMKEMAEQIGTP
jgi:hypothetical protein